MPKTPAIGIHDGAPPTYREMKREEKKYTEKWRINPDVDDMEKFSSRSKLLVTNQSGRDVLIAVYKMKRDCAWFTGRCSIEKTVRRSPRFFLPAEIRTPFQEQLLPYQTSGFFDDGDYYVAYGFLPEVTPGESESSLVSLGLDLYGLKNVKEPAILQRKGIDLVVKHWPRILRYYKKPGEGWITAGVRGAVDPAMLPNHLEDIPEGVREQIAKKRKKYRNIFIPNPSAKKNSGIIKLKSKEVIIPPLLEKKGGGRGGEPRYIVHHPNGYNYYILPRKMILRQRIQLHHKQYI